MFGRSSVTSSTLVDPCAMDADVRGYSIDDLAAIFAGEFTVEEIRVWAKWMEQ